ncbi:TPA: recombinase family protein [Streptococcus suis]
MKLTKVIINNFRSFGDSQVIGFNDQTVLIGNNSSGKTTVLQALSKLFSDKQNDRIIRKSDFHLPKGLRPGENSRTLFIETIFEFDELDGTAYSPAIPSFFEHFTVSQGDAKPFLRIRLESSWEDDGTVEGSIDTQIYYISSAEDIIKDEDKHRAPRKDLDKIRVLYVPASRTPDGELLLTILSSVAQQEVENTSAHVKKGLKMKMQRGELVGFQGCLGYDYDVETKQLSINKKEAKIVRYIFERYLEGIGGKVIARELDELGYKSPRGLEHWNDTTVLGIIKNEKYKGDILMGKTFTVDPISKRRLSNFGEEDKYYIKDNHEPIISKEDFEKAQEIRLRRAGNKKTAANVNGKRERYSKMYAFSSMLECGFCGSILSRRSWHCRSDYRKVVWHCVTSIKKGKKFCKHSKGLEELAIEGAFMEAYRQLYHSNENLMTDLLETIESELNDNSLNKELKRITNKLRTLLKKEENLVNLRLEGKISDTIYNEKYNEISSEKVFLAEEKVNIETTLKSEIDVKKRLTEFKHLLSSQKMLTEFDRAVFESIVEKIIVGGVNSDGEIDPAMLTIIFKTGETENKDGKQFKSKRKNAKLETDKLCPQNSDGDKKLYSQEPDNTRRVCALLVKA